MKRENILILIFILFSPFLGATVYEDAEDGLTDGWSIYDSNPSGATISNVVVDEGEGRAIELQGSSRQNGYMLGSIYTESKKWHDREHDSITWRIKADDDFVVYISVETTLGHRYLSYTSKRTYTYNHMNGEYISSTIGGSFHLTDNHWVFIVRNLQDDIHKYEPNNTLLSIDAFLVRGSVRVDDIETLNTTIKNPISHIYDIGGNSAAWKIYDNLPSGASVDSEEASYCSYEGQPLGTTHHTKLNGDGRKNGFMLGALWGEGKLHNTTDSIVTWRMNSEDDFVVYISVETTYGHRFISYTSKEGYSHQSGEYIMTSLKKGEVTRDGWADFSEDIVESLHKFEPDNNLISIDAFLVRGSGLIDNVITYHKDYNSLLLAESDRYNHTEEFNRDYARIGILESTRLFYLYSPRIKSYYNPSYEIGFYTFEEDNNSLSRKSILSPYNEYVYSLRKRYPTSWRNYSSAYIWDSFLGGNGAIPSDGSYLIHTAQPLSPPQHIINWRWYDISDLDNIFFVESGSYD